MVEGLRHGREDLEAEGLPEAYRRGVGLHHRVELHAVVAGGARPPHHVLAQRPAHPVALVRRVDHEARGRDVGAPPWAVRPHLRRTDHGVALGGHHRPSRRTLHPQRSRGLLGEPLGIGVRLPRPHDGREERPDPWPVLRDGDPDEAHHFHRKWMNRRPQFWESFSTRWYSALISFWSRNRRTRFLSWPDPFPGMISTRVAFLAIASSMMPRRARSMSYPRL